MPHHPAAPSSEPYRARAAAAHRTSYPEPIRLRAGQAVRVGRRDDEYPGWIWTVTDDTGAGWAPERVLRIVGERAVALEDYDATELDVEPGDRLTVHRELAGWAWVSTPAGASGWVPLAVLERR